MSILKDINELVAAKVISVETAASIQNYYNKNKSNNTSRLITAFSVLGALLVGLGIILIIAHNWDNLSRNMKVILSFIPLIIGQIACFYALFKKNTNVAWREASAVFLFLSIGASISLISQIYHIPGNLSSFVFTWMVLVLPIIYLLRSVSTTLLYIIGFTYFAASTSYFNYPSELRTHYYWLFLISVLPFYFNYLKNNKSSNFNLFLNWFLVISISIGFGIITNKAEELMFIAYICLMSLFYFIGQINLFKNESLGKNAWKLIGGLGIMFILFIASFKAFWMELRFDHLFGLEMIAILFLTATNIYFLVKKYSVESYKNLKPLEVVFVVFMLVSLLYNQAFFAAVLINLLVFSIGVYTIWKGANQESLVKLNFGLLIIGILIACRFFDTDISFVLRGVMFVLIGFGFFVANYLTLKKIKKDEE